MKDSRVECVRSTVLSPAAAVTSNWHILKPLVAQKSTLGYRLCAPGRMAAAERNGYGMARFELGSQALVSWWLLGGTQLWPSEPLSPREWWKQAWGKKHSKRVTGGKGSEKQSERNPSRGSPQMSAPHRCGISHFLVILGEERKLNLVF